MKIVFFGTPQFSANVFSYLHQHGVQIAAVVTRTDKPQGRSGQLIPTPVKKAVLELDPSIPIFQPEKVSNPEFAHILPPFEADLFVVVAYGEIVKQHILDMPKKGCINLHASLLPKYRGAAPIHRSIINGETKTGVTIMHMVKKMDAGEMIRTTEVPIGPNDNFSAIEQKLCEQGSQLLLEVIRDFEKGPVKATPQDESKATYATKIEAEDCRIDWNLSAPAIHNLVRGTDPQPGAWCLVDIKGEPKRLKVQSSRVEETRAGNPGTVLECTNEGMVVACGRQALRILMLQLEGKKSMTPAELLRGIPITTLR